MIQQCGGGNEMHLRNTQEMKRRFFDITITVNTQVCDHQR